MNLWETWSGKNNILDFKLANKTMTDVLGESYLICSTNCLMRESCCCISCSRCSICERQQKKHVICKSNFKFLPGAAHIRYDQTWQNVCTKWPLTPRFTNHKQFLITRVQRCFPTVKPALTFVFRLRQQQQSEVWGSVIQVESQVNAILCWTVTKELDQAVSEIKV